LESQVSKVLIVEDDRDLNNAYGLILKHEGYDVVEAYDGKEAIKKLDDFAPDLILLDLLMPIMGGLEFLQWWNKKNPGSSVKILIFTNMENSPEVTEAYKLGANRCIIKSWTAPHNLAKVVSDTLKSKSLKPEPETANK
jgi:two-component system response regulator VicR